MADMDKRPLSGSFIQIGHTFSSTATCRVPMIKYRMHNQIENTFTLWTTIEIRFRADPKEGELGPGPPEICQ